MRFPLRLSVEVSRIDNLHTSQVAETFELNSTLVCFVTARDFRVGGELQYTVSLGHRRAVVHCLGRVLEAKSNGDSFSVSASIDRYRMMMSEAPAI